MRRSVLLLVTCLLALATGLGLLWTAATLTRSPAASVPSASGTDNAGDAVRRFYAAADHALLTEVRLRPASGVGTAAESVRRGAREATLVAGDAAVGQGGIVESIRNVGDAPGALFVLRFAPTDPEPVPRRSTPTGSRGTTNDRCAGLQAPAKNTCMERCWSGACHPPSIPALEWKFMSYEARVAHARRRSET